MLKDGGAQVGAPGPHASGKSGDRRGVALLCGSALAFSAMATVVKLGAKELPVEMLVLARGVVTLVLSLVALRLTRVAPWGNAKRLLLLRALLGTGGLASFYYALTSLPLAEATVIHYVNPILTALLAAVVLGERIDSRLVAAIVASLCGTLLVARPSALWGAHASLSPAGVAAALLGAVFSAGAYVCVRRLATSDDPNVIVFYFPIVAVPLTLPFAIRAWVWPSPRGWLLLLAVGVATQLGQVLLTRGIALVPAGRATAIGYVQIVFATLWGLFVFGEAPTIWTIAGALVIVIATLALARR